MKIKVIRHVFDYYYTEGYMFVDGQPFGFTLEDKVRSDGLKIYGQTAIPMGLYKVTLEMSPRFQKKLPKIHDVPGFNGILIHGGNTPADTFGCVLVARKRIGPGHIQDSLSQTLVDLFEKEGNVPSTIEIIEARNHDG